MKGCAQERERKKEREKGKWDTNARDQKSNKSSIAIRFEKNEAQIQGKEQGKRNMLTGRENGQGVGVDPQARDVTMETSGESEGKHPTAEPSQVEISTRY